MKRAFAAGMVFLLCVALVRAGPTLKAYYKVDREQKKVEFWCSLEGLEIGKKYVVALGFPQSIESDTQFKQVLKIEGAELVKQEKARYRETDISRILPSIQGLDARGYEFEVKQLSETWKVEYRTEVPFEAIERAKAAHKPIIAYLSQNFGPVYYIVDYSNIDPLKILP